MENDIMTADEAARQLRISLVAIRHLLATGQLQGRKLGKSWRIHADALKQFLMIGEGEAKPCQGRCESIVSGKEQGRSSITEAHS